MGPKSAKHQRLRTISVLGGLYVVIHSSSWSDQ